MCAVVYGLVFTHSNLEESIPTFWEAPLLCLLFFSGEGGHDTKQKEHNFTKNNVVIAFKNIVV